MTTPQQVVSLFNEVATISLELRKETKHKVVYGADDGIIESLYIAKEAFGDAGYPDTIIVTVKVPT